MTFRCTVRVLLDNAVRAEAELIHSPHSSIEWTSYTELQCLVEDVPHDFHAAFLRTGSRIDPDSDVFLCWTDKSPAQGLADLECCMKRRTELSTGCTIFKNHPGRCEWEYIDPELVAVQAQADQLTNELGLTKIFRNLWDGDAL
ncbi:hypothetical protein [Streptomyces ziwulingensis]|uniref:Uncharacterized protein n=1 Tax=Streptomyces ziwulingensis TaxID=1045501 RepID=A0ABP9BHE7_9ACTN